MRGIIGTILAVGITSIAIIEGCSGESKSDHDHFIFEANMEKDSHLYTLYWKLYGEHLSRRLYCWIDEPIRAEVEAPPAMKYGGAQ